MSQHRMFGEAMNQLHAPDDVYERVMERARGAKRKRRGTARPLAVVGTAALIAAAGVGGTAYAVVNSDFFQHAMGDHGIGEPSEWADPQSGLSYRREYSTVDPDEVTEELSDAVTPVGQTVEAWGYTLFVKDMVMDENGCGIVRFTLDNPSGLRLDTDLGAPNQIVFDYDDPSALRMIGMWNAHGGFPDYRSFYDSATLTPTHLDGVMYFSPIGDSFEREARNLLDGVRLSLSWDDGEKHQSSRETEALTATFAPERVIGARRFSDGKGAYAYLSPFGIRYEVGEDGTSELATRSLALDFIDGTSKTITLSDNDPANTQIINTYFDARFPEDGTCVSLFTMFVDTAEVREISITGTRDDDETGERGTVSVELNPSHKTPRHPKARHERSPAGMMPTGLRHVQIAPDPDWAVTRSGRRADAPRGRPRRGRGPRRPRMRPDGPGAR